MDKPEVGLGLELELQLREELYEAVWQTRAVEEWAKR